MPTKKKTNQNIRKKLAENFKSLMFAVIAAMIIRTFFFEPFRIPSSSMVPSLLVGDYLFVSKYSYGYSNKGSFFGLKIIPEGHRRIAISDKPQRGDVAVFKLPSNPRINYIKRVIGIPGDTVQVKDQIVYINGVPLVRSGAGGYINDEGVHFTKFIERISDYKAYNVMEEIPDEKFDNTQVFTVPEGHYFVMGDNRDHSADSRTPTIDFPFVPLENFVGKAEIIFFSMDYNIDNWDKLKKPFGIRFNRMLRPINKSL